VASDSGSRGERPRGKRLRWEGPAERPTRVIPPGAKVIGKKKRRGGEPASLAALVVKAYPTSEPAEIAALRAFAWWARAVPPRVAKNARPVRLTKGVLIVHAATSAWVSDLSFLREQILGAIRRYAPHSGVRELRIQVGPLPPLPPPPERRSDSSPPPAPLDTVLPPDIAKALSRVGDDRLRDVLAGAARATLAPAVARKVR
jgi:predicted nucleic acid-binding Zn ribbon protein